MIISLLIGLVQKSEDWLIHWGWVTHICVGKLTIIGSDNGLLPGRCQAIIRTNDGMLLIWNSGKNFSEILIDIHTFSFLEMHLKMSAKWRLFCLGLNVLTEWWPESLTHHPGKIKSYQHDHVSAQTFKLDDDMNVSTLLFLTNPQRFKPNTWYSAPALTSSQLSTLP